MTLDYTPKTFEDLACYWFQVHGMAHKSPSSLKRDQGMLKNYLLPAFGQMEIAAIQKRHIDQWFVGILSNTKLGPKSCNDLLGLLKKILSDAVHWEFILRNPAAHVKKVKKQDKEMKYWSQEEVQQYLGYWAMRDKPRIYWAVVVALHTGLRRGELIALQWDCVEEEFLVIKRSYCRISKRVREETKSKAVRRVPINPQLRRILEQLRPLTEASGFVLPLLHPDRYHVEFKLSVANAGGRRIRFHDLRHTFATHFLAVGGQPYDLQKILGHESITTTETYTHLMPRHLAGKTNGLEY